MKRIVLDTNVLTSALRSRLGASFALLQLVAEKRVRSLATTALFLEYEAVIKRQEHIESHGFSLRQLDAFLSQFAALVEPVEVHFLWRPQLSDPKDEMVLEAAVNGRADALLTYNLRDFREALDRFEVDIMKPGDFLRVLES